MKNGLLLAFSLMLSSAIFAQTQEKKAFNSKGNSFIKLSLRDITISSQNSSLLPNFNFSNINFTTELSYGRFVMDRLAVGASFKYGNYSRSFTVGNDAFRLINYSYSLSAFAKYYLLKKNGLFVEAEYEKSLAFVNFPRGNLNGWNTYSKVGLSVGYTFMVGKKKRWSIEPKHTYFLSAQNATSGISSSHAFSIGITHYFGGKKKQKEIPTF